MFQLKVTSDCVIKSIDKSGTFHGYASVFNIIDQQNEQIMPGAFTSSIMQKNFSIKLLWQHQVDEPIGTITDLREDSYGLRVIGALQLDIQRAKEAYSLIKSGAVDSLSIGFSPKKYEDQADGTRNIYDLTLWEISLVTFPANQEAAITEVKKQTGSDWNFDEAVRRAVAILGRPADG